MTNDAFRNAYTKFLAALLIAASSALVSSCGGGGAAGNPNVGGDLQILPDPGTAYAGVPFRVTIAGGRPPYALGSSEPSIFPVPAILNGNTFEVLPGQPGVIDTGLTPGEVPRRAVVLSARDVNGQIDVANFSVLQNFLIGYGASYANDCPTGAGATGSSVQACAGRETVITVSPTFNGQRRPGTLLRFERLRGDFTFLQCGSLRPPGTAPLPPSVQLNSITQVTDGTGIANVCIFIPLGARSQIASYRIFDVASGVYTDEIFIIDGATPAGTLTTVPDTIIFTGTNGRCGTGSADFLVFDGSPPYTATSTNGTVSVTPTTSPTQPGRFTVTLAIQGSPCPSGVQVVVTDSFGARGVVTVDSVQGAAGPPLTVAPSAFTLACQQSGTGVVVGGTGTYNAFSSGGGVSATVSGNQVVITRTGGPTPVGTQDTSVNITDGNSIATITVTSPLACNP